MINKKFHRLRVISQVESRNKSSMYLCECDCGNKKTVSGSKLRNGNTKSCGCLRASMGALKLKQYRMGVCRMIVPSDGCGWPISP